MDYLLKFLASFCLLASSALASDPCTLEGSASRLDPNCDGVFTVMAVGDSIFFGRGDDITKNINGTNQHFSNKGGWGVRALAHFQALEVNFDFIQAAKPGADCKGAYARFRNYVLGNIHDARRADLAIIMCGVNGYWTGSDIETERAYIDKIQRFAEDHGIYSIVATLIPINRSYQRTWVAEMNQAVAPIAKIDLSKMSESLLSWDQLHPKTGGHSYIWSKVRKSIDKNFGAPAKHKKILEQIELSDDTDTDQIPNRCEDVVYRTDPLNIDTDADGFSDLEEIRSLRSNPLNPLSPATE